MVHVTVAAVEGSTDDSMECCCNAPLLFVLNAN